MAGVYKVIRLLSFEADVEKHAQIKQGKLDKFINDLSKSPTTLKNAHALKSILSPLWSADFNSNIGLFVVLYFLCDGVPEHCFRIRALKNDTYVKFREDMEHKCDGTKRIYLCRIERHNVYKILER